MNGFNVDFLGSRHHQKLRTVQMAPGRIFTKTIPARQRGVLFKYAACITAAACISDIEFGLDLCQPRYKIVLGCENVCLPFSHYFNFGIRINGSLELILLRIRAAAAASRRVGVIPSERVSTVLIRKVTPFLVAVMST